MKKRILIVALAAFVMLSFAGCTGGQNVDVNDATSVDNSFGDIDLTPQEPENPASYMREFVHGKFEEFSQSGRGGFSVSESEVHSNDQYDYKTIEFEVEFADSENSYDISSMSDEKSYNIYLGITPEADEIKTLLACAIYAANSGLSIDECVQEAEAMADTMPSQDSKPCRTEARQFGNCKIFVDYDDYGGFRIYSHHSSDNYYTDISKLDLSQYKDGAPTGEYGYYKFDAQVVSVWQEDDITSNDIVTVSCGGSNYDLFFMYDFDPIEFSSGEIRTFYVYYFEYGIRLEGVE